MNKKSIWGFFPCSKKDLQELQKQLEECTQQYFVLSEQYKLLLELQKGSASKFKYIEELYRSDQILLSEQYNSLLDTQKKSVLNLEHCIEELCEKTWKENAENFDKQSKAIQHTKDTIENVITVSNNTKNDVYKLSNKIDRLENAFARSYPLSILRFEVHVVEHCNLNCQSCDHFSPLAKEQFINIEIFERDFERLSILSNKMAGRIFLLGGEPLLHPQIKELFKIARKHFPYDSTRIALVTNGILLPTQKDDFWESVKNYNIEIDVTKYPINLDLSSVESLVEERGIKFRYFGNSSKKIKTSWHLPLDEKGMQDPAHNFVRCWRANNCIFLRDGRLYSCQIPANIHHFNQYFGTSIPVSEQDSIDIFKVNTIQEIFNFLSHPIAFCRFCNICGETTNHPWNLSQKDIKEWT